MIAERSHDKYEKKYDPEFNRLVQLKEDLGDRVTIDGEQWVRYKVPEYGMTYSLKCGSKVKRLSPERQREAEAIERRVLDETGKLEVSPGLLMYLGLAIPRNADISWED